SMRCGRRPCCANGCGLWCRTGIWRRRASITWTTLPRTGRGWTALWPKSSSFGEAKMTGHVQLPGHAQIVVIGGGIIGCSTAYHLARDHGAEVLMLEQGRLTSGSTWHAAGLVGQLRSSASITKVLKYSVELYQGLVV